VLEFSKKMIRLVFVFISMLALLRRLRASYLAMFVF
jgi:hypothetical protein